MARAHDREPDEDGGEPNLELPSFFGRRRRKRTVEAPAPPPEQQSPRLRPSAAPKRVPPRPPPARRPPPTAPPQVSPPESVQEWNQESAQASPRPRGPELSYEQPGPGRPGRDAASTGVLSAPVPDDAQPAKPRRRPSRPRITLPTIKRPTISLPATSPRLAAVVAGVAAALVGSLTLWLFLQGCTAVRGVSSCGGVGLLGIALALTLQVAAGAALLRALTTVEATSSAVLGVGLSATVAMVLLYASTPMLALALILLVVTPAAFVVAVGVTSAEVRIE